MEKTKKCLIVGLPSAGKSTYIGAFWAIEKDGGTNHKLTCKEYPSDTTYLDALKKSWLEQTVVERTLNIEPQEIRLKLHSETTRNTLELHIPDFKGEVFQRILSNNVAEKAVQWCNDTDCILYFIKYANEDILQDEISQVAENKDTIQRESTAMQITDISEWTQNIMLLKYLHTHVDSDIPLAICISAWDKVNTELSIESWVKSKHPFLYNFIQEHFSNVKYFGVSAQGLEYKDEKFEEYQRLTELKQRAYIYTDKKSHDITEPFEFLINQ
jgi:GTPase SAR1 family protein